MPRHIAHLQTCSTCTLSINKVLYVLLQKKIASVLLWKENYEQVLNQAISTELYCSYDSLTPTATERQISAFLKEEIWIATKYPTTKQGQTERTYRDLGSMV